MKKEDVYKQIDDFNEYIVNDIETKNKRFFYVEREIAEDRGIFFGFILKEYFKGENKFKNIVDLTFGSGNLTSHLLLDNNIEYNSLILNDIEKVHSNQEILLENSLIKSNDILTSPFEDKFDLIIFNPPIGNKSVSNRIDIAKSTKNIDKIKKQIDLLIKQNNIFVFYGEEKHYQEFFDNYNFIKYITDDEGKDLFIISKTFKESICYEKQANDFVVNEECKKQSLQDEKKDYDLKALTSNLQKSMSFLEGLGAVWGSEDKKDSEIKQEVKEQPQQHQESKTQKRKPFKNFLYKGKN